MQILKLILKESKVCNPTMKSAKMQYKY